MVNPITSNVAPVSANPASIALERPTPAPEPAKQVTPAAETISANTSTAADSRNTDGAFEDPLDKALKQLNSNMRAWSTSMRFDIDPDSRRVIVSIIDSATGKVLRTVPSETVIQIAKMIVQLQGKGVNTKA